MDQVVAIFIDISCPNFEEAEKHCRALLEKDLIGTAKIFIKKPI